MITNQGGDCNEGQVDRMAHNDIFLGVDLDTNPPTNAETLYRDSRKRDASMMIAYWMALMAWVFVCI